jgi:hypothetical protein
MYVITSIGCIYSAAIMNGYSCIILGALGCGAFCNDSATVARCFREVLQEPLYAGRFESVIFAILGAPAIEFAQEFAHWPALESPGAVPASSVIATVVAPVPSSLPLPSAALVSAPLPIAQPVVDRRDSMSIPSSPPGGPITNEITDLASSIHLP